MTLYVRCDVRASVPGGPADGGKVLRLSILTIALVCQIWRQSVYITINSNIWPWMSDVTSEHLQYYLFWQMTWFVRCDVRASTVLSILTNDLVCQMWRQSASPWWPYSWRISLRTWLSILTYDLVCQMWRQSVYSTIQSIIWPGLSDVTSERLQYNLF